MGRTSCPSISGATGYNSTKEFISSFSRDAVGTISVGTIAIDVATTALFDSGYGGTAPAASTGSIVETTSATVAGHTATALGTPTYTAGTSTLAVTHYTADAQNAGQVFSVGLSITGANASTAVAAAASGAAGALQGTDTLGAIATSTGHELSISGSTMTFYVAENNGAATNNVQYYQYTVTGLRGGVLDNVDTSTVGTYTDAHGTVTSSSASGTGASIFNIDISALTDSAADQAKLNAFQKQVDAAISNVTASASALGTARSRITSQSSFVQSLQTSLNNGVGSLVDADLNVASTRLQALQVQQQLGVQSLSIANQSTQAILKLFQ